MKQAWVAAKRNYRQKDQPIHQICGNIVEQVMKDSVSYKTLDNITVVMIAFNNFKTSLADEFQSINFPDEGDGQSGSISASEGDQRPIHQVLAKGELDNHDSSNGGLMYSENKEVSNATKDDCNRILHLPNTDLVYADVEKMVNKPRMPNINISRR